MGSEYDRVSVIPPSPKGAGGGSDHHHNHPSSAGASPKGPGMCLCSPTTHEGSFRCRFHRTNSGGKSSGWTMKRTNSIPASKNGGGAGGCSQSVVSLSPKSVESA